MSADVRRLICISCDTLTPRPLLLTAEHPFQSGETLEGCPECLDVEWLRMACDVPDCHQEVTCGTPTPDGYRSTCVDHKPTPTSPGKSEL